MICPVCFGRKYDFKEEGNSGYFVVCRKCHGTGVIDEQTNEEWRKSCSTEEFAEFLSDIVFNAIVDYRINKNNCEKEDGNYWLKWLKEKHNEHI